MPQIVSGMCPLEKQASRSRQILKLKLFKLCEFSDVITCFTAEVG